MSDPPSNDSDGQSTHFVYVLECSDGTFYTGYTTDVDRRVDEHNDGTAAKYTRGRRPVELIYVERFDQRSMAMQREHAIKQLRRPAKEQLITSGTEPPR